MNANLSTTKKLKTRAPKNPRKRDPNLNRKKKQLSVKQVLFCLAYIETGNATEAARRAGYKASDNVLAGIGYENLRKPQIARRIQERLNEADVTADEVIKTLGSQMRADTTDLFDDHDRFNIQTLRERKLGHLIKKIKFRREAAHDSEEPVDIVEVELHSQQAAAAHLSKILGIEQSPASPETRERDRQVRFLSYTIKQTREEVGGKVTVEEIWNVVERRELEMCGEDVSQLRDAVLATL